jgi:hypothetical protein
LGTTFSTTLNKNFLDNVLVRGLFTTQEKNMTSFSFLKWLQVIMKSKQVGFMLLAKPM